MQRHRIQNLARFKMPFTQHSVGRGQNTQNLRAVLLADPMARREKGRTVLPDLPNKSDKYFLSVAVEMDHQPPNFVCSQVHKTRSVLETTQVKLAIR